MTDQKTPFITFEGGEGTGKSTQVEILYKRLLQNEIDVVAYREPGGTKGAEHIREILLTGDEERWTPTTEALLMSAARCELVQRRIVPQLRAGTWVLCDRFTDSTIAYQGYGHGLGYKPMEELNRFTVGALEPELTFIFQLDPELGLTRASLREGVHDRFERFHPGFHQRVAAGYEDILKKHPHRCVAINALLDINMISELIFKEVCRRFGI